MLRKRVSELYPLGTRVLSSSPATVEAPGISKREDYYKTLAERVMDDSKPPDWDSALPYEEIPGPEPWLPALQRVLRLLPIIGRLQKNDFLERFHELNKKYGDIVATRGITRKLDNVLVFDPNDIEKVNRYAGQYPIRYIAESQNYYRTNIRDDVFRDCPGLLAMQGERWFKLRSVINPILMHPKTVHQYVSKIDNALNQLVNRMRHLSKIDANRQMPKTFIHELDKWAMNSMGAIALGRTYEDHEAVKFVTTVGQALLGLHHLETRPPLWKYFPTPTFRKFVKNFDILTAFLIDSIEKASAENYDSTPEHELSIYHRIAKQDKKVALTIVMDLMIAGIDTTSKTWGGILYLLAKHPDKQAILREELRKSLPDKEASITDEILNNTPYAKAIVKESYRLTPAAGGTLRTTGRDMVLSGYQVPKGTTVALTTVCATKNPKYFKDPEKFLPERWLRSNSDEYSAKNTHPYASLAFGAGPRSCVGVRLATLELELAVMKIVRNFELTWNHPDMQYDSKLLTYIKDPLQLTVKEVE